MKKPKHLIKRLIICILFIASACFAINVVIDILGISAPILIRAIVIAPCVGTATIILFNKLENKFDKEEY